MSGDDDFPAVSPGIYCSQHRVIEYEQEHGPLPGHEKVGDWLRDVQEAFRYPSDSEGPSSLREDQYPVAPAAPRKDQYVPDTDTEFPDDYVFRDGQLMFHKRCQGRRPYTFVYEGGRHDWYGVHNESDLLWARRSSLVLKLDHMIHIQ